MRKTVFLVVALVLPVIIYLFLQLFGNNQYELPILYQDEIPNNVGCQNIAAPYKLDFGRQENPILLDVRLGSDNDRFISNELLRVKQQFENAPYDYEKVMRESSEQLSEYARCELLYEGNNSFLVLVDNQGRIRSYYDSSSKQEFDRLITELEILQKFK